MPVDVAEKTLEDFALKGNHLAKMTGVSVATHAIPDAFLLMHTGVGCKYKTAAQIGPHDWGSHPNRREAWTQIGELQLVKGSSERIEPFVRAWYERRRPAFMAVVSAYFVELTGEDFSDAVVRAEGTVPCDMALVQTAGPNGGLYDGYASTILAILKKLDWKKVPQDRPSEAAVVGYWFDRYEADHKGNLGQMKLLLKACGIDLGPVFLSGTPYQRLTEAPRSGHLISMPYMGKLSRRIKRTTKRPPIELDLPMGLGGTSRFLRELGAATGADIRRLEAWIEAQTTAVEKQLDMVRDHTRDVQLAVFADGPLAAGLVTAFHEMGVGTPLVGIRETWLGGKTKFLETLDRNGVELARDTEVIEHPSLRLTRERVVDYARNHNLAGVVGSAHETNLFRRNATLMARFGERQHFALEIGFPSDNHHLSFAAPYFGFIGVLTLAQRVLDKELRVL